MSFKILALLSLLSMTRGATTADACASLTSLSLENTTIISASYQGSATNISTPFSCVSTDTFITTANVCRVQGFINTTSSSSLGFEAWLPDTWYGRFMGLGNTGTGGCYDWPGLDYGSQLHFATISTNNGHDGLSGAPFLNHPEVINDFAYRSIHVEAIIGKQIVQAYYNREPSKSYYLGCSTGGRQAYQTATLYPEDFDGIIGGSPGVDWNNLVGSGILFGKYVDAPYENVSKGFITGDLWPIVSQEILSQCDHLDGLVDGIIAEPDDCFFDPEPLLCSNGSIDKCLTRVQVDALHKIYSPILGSDGKLLSARFDPGAEADDQWQIVLGGTFFGPASDWFTYSVYNDSSYSFDNFTVSNVEFADKLDVGNIATWSGDLSAFKERGGKFLTFHGRSDPVIPSGISKRLYERISLKLQMSSLDEFYRLFSIPGMQHCVLGPGAWAFGQGAGIGAGTNAVNDTSHNILLALVDWVEGSQAPDFIVGLDQNGAARAHCRHPYESRWNGSEWVCV